MKHSLLITTFTATLCSGAFAQDAAEPAKSPEAATLAKITADNALALSLIHI